MIPPDHTHEGADRRTNIVIDDALMKEAMEVTGLKTKKEVVELGLLSLVRLRRQAKIREYRGKLTWGWDDPPERRAE